MILVARQRHDCSPILFIFIHVGGIAELLERVMAMGDQEESEDKSAGEIIDIPRLRGRKKCRTIF